MQKAGGEGCRNFVKTNTEKLHTHFLIRQLEKYKVF
jgi:hypothetical protein